MSKVRCKFCGLEVKGRCVKKDVSIKVNKKRVCKFYVDDKNKIEEYAQRKVNNPKPEVTFRPDWLWDRRLRRMERDRMREQIQKQAEEEIKKKEQEASNILLPGRDFKHPLTGNLKELGIETTIEDGED